MIARKIAPTRVTYRRVPDVVARMQRSRLQSVSRSRVAARASTGREPLSVRKARAALWSRSGGSKKAISRSQILAHKEAARSQFKQAMARAIANRQRTKRR